MPAAPLPAPVFGPDRPAAAILAIQELTQAREAASRVCWTNEPARERVRRAAAIRAQYAEYGDTFTSH